MFSSKLNKDMNNIKINTGNVFIDKLKCIEYQQISYNGKKVKKYLKLK